jgi:hypothetical protein
VTDLRDWTFTAADAQTIKEFQDFLAFEQGAMAYQVFFVQTMLAAGASNDQIASALLLGSPGLAQGFIVVPGLPPSLSVFTQLQVDGVIAGMIPGAGPLADLVSKELALDVQLFQAGVPLTSLDQFIFFQLLVNLNLKVELLQLAEQAPASPSM